MFSKIDHVAIHVKEINKVIKFYEEVFGFKILFENLIPSGLKVVYLKLGNTIIEINESYEGKITGCHFCLHTDNFESDYNSLIDKDIEVFQSPHNTNPRTPEEKGWRRAVFLGLAGERIEIRG